MSDSRARAECQRILDAEARRLLREKLEKTAEAEPREDARDVARAA